MYNNNEIAHVCVYWLSNEEGGGGREKQVPDHLYKRLNSFVHHGKGFMLLLGNVGGM